MDHRKLGIVLFLVGVLTGAVVASGVIYHFSVRGLKDLLKNREVEIDKLLEQVKGKEELLRYREEEISGLSEQIKYKQEEISKLEELLKKYELPTIMNISWEPTQIVNNKVYDGRVSFVVESKYSPVAEAYLIFTPRIYAHLPKEAFPEEFPRGYILTPVDGVFDENREEFSVDITNIKGGREYDITAIPVNSLGMMNKGELPIPYIREFENIAALDDILVIATFYPWYTTNAWNSGESSWDWWAPYPKDRLPLLGKYNSCMREVISRHIDMATGFGIDAFFVSWGFDNWGLYDRAVKIMMENELISDIKFAILYEKAGRLKIEPGSPFADLSDGKNVRILRSDFSYLGETFMKHPSYLKIGNKCVFTIDASWGLRGNVKKAIDLVREDLAGKGVELYFLSDQVSAFSPNDPDQQKILEAADGITAYQVFQGPSDFWNPDPSQHSKFIEKFNEYTRERFNVWGDVARSMGIDFIPTGTTGFDRTLVSPGVPRLPKSVVLFEIQLKICKEYLDADVKAINIVTFNEWFENSATEPSLSEGFAYLQSLKRALGL